MDKQPKLMSLPRMRDILEPHHAMMHEHFYIDGQLAIVRGFAEVMRFIIRQDPPFYIDDCRLGIVIRGEVRVNLNLVEKSFTPGMLIFIGPGSIISPVRLSPDLEICGVAISADFPLPFAHGQRPQAFNGQRRDFQLQASQADANSAKLILDALWHLVHQKDYNPQAAACLIASLMHLYDGLFHQYTHRQTDARSREKTVFDRFIYLVNQHAQREHHIAFYAEKMCLTERYLGTVVRQASGTTAKEWIDRAIITRIKVELRHTDKTIARISDEMGFPNTSFFCKYFKRLTSKTPTEYRQT
ncbi:MAG: AraC family transcriptional regulator [Prevotella sp.]|nr:AraC family transcriptional regulator [Prevotella sp.]